MSKQLTIAGSVRVDQPALCAVANVCNATSRGWRESLTGRLSVNTLGPIRTWRLDVAARRFGHRPGIRGRRRAGSRLLVLALAHSEVVDDQSRLPFRRVQSQ